MAMRRYGEVLETGRADDYVLYALKEREHELPRRPDGGRGVPRVRRRHDLAVLQLRQLHRGLRPLRQGAIFPRQIIRYLQLGLEDRLLESPEPWLCYYCGNCSDTCPREAQPGELMMATRRWLTSRYDWTGLRAGSVPETWWQSWRRLGVVALLVLLLFVVPADFGFRLLARHPEARANVMLGHFAPTDVVHVGDRSWRSC